VFKVTAWPHFEKNQAGKLLTPTEKLPTPAPWPAEAPVPSAHQHGVRLFVDAEESWFHHRDQLAYDMMAKYNRERPLSEHLTSSTATTGWTP
jgi:proline dehydrogenase